MQERRAAANQLTDAFRRHVARIGCQQFGRVDFREIGQRHQILYHLDIALHFQIAVTDKRGQLLTIAQLRQNADTRHNGTVGLAFPGPHARPPDAR